MMDSILADSWTWNLELRQTDLNNLLSKTVQGKWPLKTQAPGQTLSFRDLTPGPRFGSCPSTERPASRLEACSVLQAKHTFVLLMSYHDCPVTYIMFKGF